MNAARNLLSMIRNEDEGSHNNLGTLQKLPILFWLDIQLRRRTLYKESESFLEILICVILPLCLLILRKRVLSYVYKIILCAFFMKLTLPFLPNITNKSIFRIQDLSSLIQERKLYIRTYVFGGVCFLSMSLCISSIKLIAEMLNGSRQRLLVLGLLLGGQYIVKLVCPVIPILGEYNIFCFGSQQLVMAMFAKELFQFDLGVFCTLLLAILYLLVHNLPFYVYIIYGLFLIQHYKIDDLISNLKSQFVTQEFNKSVLRERIMYVIFSYELIAIIAILYELHQTNNKEAGISVILHKTVTILCSTIPGTVCYIIFVMYICLAVICIVVWFLQDNNQNEPIDESSVLAPPIVLTIVSFQTFKIGYINHGSAMCFGPLLIAGFVLEDIHRRVEPVLLSLGTSGGSYVQNCKAISVFIALVSLPITVVVYLLKWGLSNHLGIFWTIVVTSSFLSVSIAAFGSILLYFLLAFDTYRSEPLQHLDEIMYWIRAIVGLVEIGIGMLNMFYLGWNITAIQWSWLNFLILAATIFTTYDRVKNGLVDFQKRRLAVKRLAFLPNATNEQLLQNNDVCAICLRPMTSAKITPCSHLFHESCLKRWSYIKETCPLCNKIINVEWFVQRIVSAIRQEMGNIQEN